MSEHGLNNALAVVPLHMLQTIGAISVLQTACFIIAYTHGIIWWQYPLELDTQKGRKRDLMAKKAATRNRKSKVTSSIGFHKEKTWINMEAEKLRTEFAYNCCGENCLA